MVVYKRTRQNAPKWREEEIPRSDTVLLIDGYIQVWDANVRPLLARMGHASKHGIFLGLRRSVSRVSGMGKGGGAARKYPYRCKRTSESRKPIPIPWSAVINTRTHVSGEESKDERSACA